MKKGEKISISIPVELTGLPVGVTQGGFVEKYTFELMVSCVSEKVPEKIIIDISALDIGHRIYVKDLAPIEGADYMESPNKPVVGVMISSKAASEAGDSPDEEKAAEGDKPEEAAKEEPKKD